MSQFGMQMPGSQMRRGPSVNVYTTLMFLAVVCLLAAVVVVWQAAASVSPKQGLTAPFELQNERSVTLPAR